MPHLDQLGIETPDTMASLIGIRGCCLADGSDRARRDGQNMLMED
jgi:hypothetical protein